MQSISMPQSGIVTMRFANEEIELANMRARLGHTTEPDMKADARIDVRLSGG